MFQGVPGLFRAVPDCSGGVPGVFRGVPGVFRGVPGCSGVFRGVPGCSGCVPGFTDTRKQVAKTRGDIFNPSPGASGTFVCSNHFPLGRRTLEDPKTDYPSVFMTVSDYLQKKSPKKRKANKLQEAGPSRCLLPRVK